LKKLNKVSKEYDMQRLTQPHVFLDHIRNQNEMIRQEAAAQGKTINKASRLVVTGKELSPSR
jgi:hypothetical protein